ncbi:hypothetical protein MMC09_003384 [Bachmanniomyces sp. S44760]|nr:hypothetical protein [Bachmanniomyces sp. S44760]
MHIDRFRESSASDSTTASDHSRIQDTARMIDEFSERLLQLVFALENHPKMNREDPSKSPQSLFYILGFVVRTWQNLLQTSVEDLASKRPEAIGQYMKQHGRSVLSQMIVCDQNCKAMRNVAGGHEPVAFGAEAWQLAEACASTGERCVGL